MLGWGVGAYEILTMRFFSNNVFQGLSVMTARIYTSIWRGTGFNGFVQ